MTEQKTLFPSIGYSTDTLLVFVAFDETYPEQILLDLTKAYGKLLNDYIKKKQKVPKPISYKIVPVVIQPPTGVARISPNHIYFSNEEIQKIYDSATRKTGNQDFKVFIVSPIIINGFGGYYGVWNGIHFIVAPLIPREAYSSSGKKAGLNGIASFQRTFLTISHEILHSVGLLGDHTPMGYGTYFLEIAGLGTDSKTGNFKKESSPCDFLGKSEDYYAVELPANLKIKVGEEPSWLYKEKSPSGDCLSGVYNNEYLKNFNKVGEYKIMYKNNLIGKELQRSLGWVDIDGDNVAEIIDENAYGGWSKEFKPSDEGVQTPHS